MKISFNNSYAKLPNNFYSKTNPRPVPSPHLIIFNKQLANDLGIEELSEDGVESLGIFAGNKIPKGAEPIAMAYAGHQFGGFSPQLGDGRAILLGEVINAEGVRFDFQLKGAGRTPWSRGGDGRSALGPVLREYLLSEAMAKLGVPTTRALAAVTTGEQVARTSLVEGGVLTRISTGFVRVGTFQYFAAKGNQVAIQQLADYEIERHYPEAKNADNPYITFFKLVVDRQAKLIAQWMSFGFIHGVMNTDNMSIAGETIDYGPCAFMDDFSHDRVYSSIDHQARYAYANQPKIGQWNLTRLAETLLYLFDEIKDDNAELAIAIAQECLKTYQDLYEQYWLAGMRRKLGLSEEHDSDAALVGELLDIMESNKADFTLTFFHLSRKNKLSQLRKLFSKPVDLDIWIEKWQQRLAKESLTDAEHFAIMQVVNPAYIPRNHQVEAAIRAAEDNNNFSLFHDLHAVLENPFELQQGKEKYLLPPEPEEVVHQTFCGT